MAVVVTGPFTIVAIVSIAVATVPMVAQGDVEDDAVALYREQPICLHGARTDEVDRLPGIATATARRLVDIAAARPAWTIDDLADSLCLTPEQRLILLLCTAVDCRRTVVHGVLTARATGRIDDVRGVRDDIWLGPAVDAVQRLDVRWDGWRLSVVGNRVAGEDAAYAWIGGAVQIPGAGWWAILGDFRPSVGLGLVLGRSGRGSRPSDADVTGTVRPWTSSSRYGALRGAAATRVDSIGGAALTTTIFVSRRPFSTTQDSTGTVTAIRRESTVRTAVEATKPRIREDGAGIVAGIVLPSWSATVYGFLLDYDRPIDTRASWAPVGRGGLAFGLTTSFSGYRGLSAITDIARSPSGAIAAMAMIDWSAHGRGRITLRGRYVGADYRAPYGNAETDATSVANEAGIGIGFYGLRFAAWRVDATIDLRQSLARTFGVPAIVDGLTVDLTGSVRLAPRTTGTVRLSLDDEDDGLRPDGVDRTLSVPRQRLRCRLAVQRQWPSMAIYGRLDAVRCAWDHHRRTETGVAATLGVRWTASRWAIAGQWTVHRAPTVESAPYVTVTVAPGATLSSAMTGNGSRTLLRGTVDILPWLSITATWQTTVSVSRLHLGSGAMETSGPLDRRVTVQITTRFHHEPAVDLPRRVAVDDEASTRLE